jgi:hypothetical protein
MNLRLIDQNHHRLRFVARFLSNPSRMNIRFRITTLAFGLLCFTNAKAQLAPEDSIFNFRSTIQNQQIFVYQLAESEYITNENDQIMDMAADTMYVVFERKAKTKTGSFFTMQYMSSYLGNGKGVTGMFSDSLRNMVYELEFDTSGRLSGIRNWTVFRDIYLADAAKKLRENVINAEQYNQIKEYFEKRDKVEATVAQDIFGLFSQNGKELLLNAEYLVVREMANPFTREPVIIQGKIYYSRPQGTKNTYMGFGAWETDGQTEQDFLNDYNRISEMIRKADPSRQVRQVTNVKLNCEVQWTYNRAQAKLMNYRVADVVLMNNSSKGRIRAFQLWDLVN